jgi:uncharacterized membrane protein
LALIAPLVGTALFLPYFVGYAAPPLGLGIVADRTPLSSLLVLFGGPLLLLAGLGLFTRWCVGDRRGWLLSAAGVGIGLILAGLGQPTLGLLLASLVLLVPWPGVLDGVRPSAAATVGIGAFAAAMLLGVELIYLDDVFHSRMNTVFKFHENAWMLVGLAAGVGLALVGHFTRRVRWLLTACAALVLAGGLVYPLSAIATRLDERPPYGLTLDGLAFLHPDERAAVRWLAQQNAASPDGRVVIAEAVGNEYSSAARMATYSGAATVLGWAGHELQWRGPISELGRREADLASVYRDSPPDGIRPVLERYGVRFVVVADLERERYGGGVDTRFEGVLPVAFRAGSVTIYRAA